MTWSRLRELGRALGRAIAEQRRLEVAREREEQARRRKRALRRTRPGR